MGDLRPDSNAHLAYPFFKGLLAVEKEKAVNMFATVEPTNHSLLAQLSGQIKSYLHLEKVFRMKLEEHYNVKVE